MYISEVIQRAKTLFPTEYSPKEYILWCDELSAYIRKNLDPLYQKIKCSTSCVLLPEDITINDIAKIIMGERELKKTDFRDFGIEYQYTPEGIRLAKKDEKACDFEIIYALSYRPIRYIDDTYDAEISNNRLVIKDIPLLENDTIKVTSEDTASIVTITKKDGDTYYVTGDILPTFKGQVKIYRFIKDKTLLPAPYDSAYIDFVNAKASLYQGDKHAYNAFMSQYNSKISDYKYWLNRNKPRTEARFKNWF